VVVYKVIMQFPQNLEQSDYIVYNSKKYIHKNNAFDKLSSGLNITQKRIKDIKLTENTHMLYAIIKIGNSNRKRALISLEGIKHIIDNLPNIAIDMDIFYDFCINWSLENDKNTNIDTAHYTNKCAWVYLLHIKDNLYKYGETYDIDRRLKCHKDDFNYTAIIDKIPCSNKTVARRSEQTFSHHLRSEGILTEYTGNMQKRHVEIFTTDNINKYLYTLRDIVQAENDRYVKDFPGMQAVRLEMIMESNKQKELMLQETAANIEHAVHTFANEKVGNLNSLMKEMLNKNDMTTSKLEIMRNELDKLLEDSDAERSKQINNMGPITVTRAYNKPCKHDISLEPIYKFVQNCLMASPGNKMCKWRLFNRMFSTPYCKLFADYKGTMRQDLNVSTYGVINMLLGVECKKADRKHKDTIYDIDFKTVVLEDFIDSCCLRFESTKEPIEPFQIAYKNYCASIDAPYVHDTLVKEMRKYEITSTNGKKLYKGIVLKSNSLDTFIRAKCEFCPTGKIKVMKFMEYYDLYCSENNLNKYDMLTVKTLITSVYKAQITDGGHQTKIITGIKILGIVDETVNKPTKEIQFDVADFTSKHLIKSEGGKVPKKRIAPLVKLYTSNTLMPDPDVKAISKMIREYHKSDGDIKGYTEIKRGVPEFVEKFVDKTKTGYTQNHVVMEKYTKEFGEIKMSTLTRELIKLGYIAERRNEGDTSTRYYNFVLLGDTQK
jgi:hypothetical protein